MQSPVIQLSLFIQIFKLQFKCGLRKYLICADLSKFKTFTVCTQHAAFCASARLPTRSLIDLLAIGTKPPWTANAWYVHKQAVTGFTVSSLTLSKQGFFFFNCWLMISRTDLQKSTMVQEEVGNDAELNKSQVSSVWKQQAASTEPNWAPSSYWSSSLLVVSGPEA